MPPADAPSPADFARDLAADLSLCADAARTDWRNEAGLMTAAMWGASLAGWPAAVRRALAAEARVVELEGECGQLLRLLDQCRDDWQRAIEERDEILDRVIELEDGHAT
jgi:hypothetical protein